ncbi:hypothetical protein KR009_005435, partial [Drosophila setifemur]
WTMAELYGYPMMGERQIILGEGIGFEYRPTNWSFSDPVLLRHILCLVIVIHYSFHVGLCCRQLKMCKKKTEPPDVMEGIMSQEAFLASKDKELHAVWLQLTSYILDGLFSIMDLYFSTLAFLWKIAVAWYGYADIIWLNVTFTTLLSIYLVIRIVPLVLYEKLSLDPAYNVVPEKAQPLVGLICTLAFLAVFLQMAIVPITTIVMLIDRAVGWYAILGVWCFVVLLSLAILGFIGLFGVICVGRIQRLDESQINEDLRTVLEHFHFPLHRVHMVHTFHVGAPTAWVIGCCCCLRLDIHDNLKLNRGLAMDDVPADHVGAGLNDEQLAAFVAHQLAHWKLWHVAKTSGLIYFSLLIYLMIFAISHKFQALYQAAGFTASYPHVIGYWLVYKYLMPPYHLINTWIVYYLIRHFEYHADEYVCRMHFGSSMRSALLKLFADSRVFPYVDHGYLMWHRSRPSSLQRIMNLNRWQGMRMSGISLI